MSTCVNDCVCVCVRVHNVPKRGFSLTPTRDKILDVLLGLLVYLSVPHLSETRVSSSWFNRLQSGVCEERHEGIAFLGVLFTL